MHQTCCRSKSMIFIRHELVTTLKEQEDYCRLEEGRKRFGEKAEELADFLELPESSRARRTRTAPIAFKDYVMEANIGENAPNNRDCDGFVQDVFEIVGKVDAESEKRFGSKNIPIMQDITSL